MKFKKKKKIVSETGKVAMSAHSITLDTQWSQTDSDN